jgi:hypothetical protein
MTSQQFAERGKALALEAARQRELSARTLDEFHPGEQQSEIDHNLQSERSTTGDFRERKYRDARGGWFSFELNVAPDKPNELLVTYWGDDAGERRFDISLDGKLLATQTLNRDMPGKFWEKSYPIPAELTKGKNRATVRFQAHPNNFAGGIFGAKMLKAKDGRSSQ